MKAMVFAAGLGSRLQPLTSNLPKALVKVRGVPLLEIVIKKLIREKYDQIIINIHHRANQITDFLQEKKNFGIDIHISDESDQLLDTGGGLKKAAWFFDDNNPFLAYNVDVLSDLPIATMLAYHKQSESLATLAVRNRSTSRYLLFDDNSRLCGWENIKTGEKIISNPKEHYKQLAFSGIQIIEPEIFNLITEEGKFSIIDVYLRLAKEHKITGYRHDDSYWLDAGRVENIAEAERELQVHRLKFHLPLLNEIYFPKFLPLF